ncbi:MAG TPA: TonB-dependent receptor [Allosphingosinicella sp.]|nr:TonB-dependent receptor [Allosphingosinicella sp.]
MNKYGLLSAVAAVAVVAPTAAYAQETTSTIRGEVTSGGTAVSGAQVTITHVPSGSVSRTTTDASGNFNMTGLRLGGPFTVTVEPAGQPSYQVTEIYLSAGEPFFVPIDLAATAEGTAPEGTDADIVVTAQAIGAGTTSLSPTTALRRDDIQGVASVNRDVRDLIRRSPFATLDPTNVRATSIAGQNPRFNRFSVNGVQFSDDFGLNNGGLPTSRGPVPLDAICEFTVEVAPVDIREGDFQGGAINTQLCQGTNRFTGGAFYTYNDDNLTGDRVRGQDVVLDVRNQAYGAYLRGPIIPDHLFFALAWERTRETEPVEFGPQGEGFGNPINGITRAEVTQVQQIAQSVYGYDAGDTPASAPESDDRVTARVDWNISDNHNMSLTYIYNNGSQFVAGSSTSAPTGTNSPRLALFSNSYELTERVHSGVVQLNSRWSDVFSTEARISYRDYDRGQTPPNGREFGQFTVCLDPTSVGSLTTCTAGTNASNPGSGTVVFGPDISRQANILATENLDAQLVGNINLGSHNIKLLGQVTNVNTYNLFLQRASGAFYFDSLAAFQNGVVGQLDLAQSPTGDINDAAAEFTYTNFTVGIQDSWDVTDRLLLVAGLRYEWYSMGAPPTFNQFFANRYGFSNQQTLENRGALLPRIGFNYRPTDRLQFRATLGRYASGTPDVWISNSYSNTGINQNRITFNRTAGAPGCTPASAGAAICTAALNGNFLGGPGIPASVLNYVRTDLGALEQAGVNAVDPAFELPAQWRLAGTISYNADLGALGDDWFFAVDAMYGRVDRAIDYVDLRSIQIGTAPDGRPRFGPNPAFSAAVRNSQNSDLLLTTTGEGHSLILVGRFNKEWESGFSLGASYTFMDIEERAPLTSSVAFSNYQQQATANPNGSSLGTGNEQIRHSVRFNAGFRREFIRNAETRIDIFGEWRNGRPFSYTMDTLQSSGRDPVFGVFGADNRHLLYVPTGISDPRVAGSDAATLASLENFIINTPLRDYRGQIAGKNIGRSPDWMKVDLRIQQTVPLFGPGRLRLFADMENVLNFIDSDWGALRQVSFPYTQAIVDAACVASGPNPCASYRYTNFREPTVNTFTNVSLWAVRVGARIEF